ncbi:hypothetical protein [Pseudoalteromonas sp.]|uniref:hypothetical protein n=1 Tax=Pseudoalteromonas sp. TaxID=53249 RepID=UPI00356391D6
MTAVKKSVRLVDATQVILHNLSLSGETNWSGSINAMAEQFELIMVDNLPELTDNEWLSFYCAFNGYMPNPSAEQEARLLPWHISEGYLYDEQIRGFLGSEENAVNFIDRIKTWSTTERLAVIYKARSYWRKGQAEGGDFEE